MADRALKTGVSGDLHVERQAHLAASAISFLQTQIQPIRPIWFEKGWAASPSLLLELYLEIRRTKPALVLDVGSGLTTLIAAYAVAANGTGKVVAWEHLVTIQEQSQALISQHSLDGVARVEFHPLQQIDLDGQEFAWFEVEGLSPTSVDLLIVDSPPGKTGHMARLPAVPMLREFLSDRIVVFLDDCHRPDERATLEKWLGYLPGARLEFHATYEERSFAVVRTQHDYEPPLGESNRLGSQPDRRSERPGQEFDQPKMPGGNGGSHI